MPEWSKYSVVLLFPELTNVIGDEHIVKRTVRIISVTKHNNLKKYISQEKKTRRIFRRQIQKIMSLFCFSGGTIESAREDLLFLGIPV